MKGDNLGTAATAAKCFALLALVDWPGRRARLNSLGPKPTSQWMTRGRVFVIWRGRALRELGGRCHSFHCFPGSSRHLLHALVRAFPPMILTLFFW
jgi:hypothetical protein